jgi:hypothetical protein
MISEVTPKAPSYGPSLGNVPTPDYYLRIVKNIQGITKAINDLIASQPGPLLTPQQILQAQTELQASGSNPINITNLPGIPQQGVSSVNNLGGQITIVAGNGVTITVTGQKISIALPNVGPGAATYTVGAKLTGGGTNGQITLDAQGRVTAVTQAT